MRSGAGPGQEASSVSRRELYDVSRAAMRLGLGDGRPDLPGRIYGLSVVRCRDGRWQVRVDGDADVAPVAGGGTVFDALCAAAEYLDGEVAHDDIGYLERAVRDA